MFCGQYHPSFIELHHVKPVGSKHTRHGEMVQVSKYTVIDLAREIKQTIPVCCNCHKVLHWRAVRRRWYEGDKGVSNEDWEYMAKRFSPEHPLRPVSAWPGWEEMGMEFVETAYPLSVQQVFDFDGLAAITKGKKKPQEK